MRWAFLPLAGAVVTHDSTLRLHLDQYEGQARVAIFLTVNPLNVHPLPSGLSLLFKVSQLNNDRMGLGNIRASSCSRIMSMEGVSAGE
jgi:hypothetical protein